MLYNIVLATDTQQHGLVISTHRSPLFEPPSLTYRISLGVTEYPIELPVSYSNFPLAICFTHGNIYIQCYPFNLSHHLLPSPCPKSVL